MSKMNKEISEEEPYSARSR